MSDKDFLSLQREWYKKLEDEGFEDLEWTSEKTGGMGPYLQRKKLKFSILPGIADYFYAATELALKKLMEDEDSYRDIQIYALHADGCPGREAARVMGLSRDTIQRVLRKFVTEVKRHAQTIQ